MPPWFSEKELNIMKVKNIIIIIIIIIIQFFNQHQLNGKNIYKLTITLYKLN